MIAGTGDGRLPQVMVSIARRKIFSAMELILRKI